MIFPATPAFFAALLALVDVGLSGWVVAGRLRANLLHGDGDDPDLLKRIRSHGKCAEFVPLSLLLVALLEGGILATVGVTAVAAVALHVRGRDPDHQTATSRSRRRASSAATSNCNAASWA
ncbi:MAG: MAPEG family protein [Methylobacterium sp.]|uniref:MAPEG family protein n=1 Tax=Methylobacterium sp. TaxID=409 RepID=UPI00258A3FE0|nr:MAPEG family protein [Methylobacterium sp.]MBY0297543.1 MAPEG family protein [Methylobacterium sp.]